MSRNVMEFQSVLASVVGEVVTGLSAGGASGAAAALPAGARKNPVEVTHRVKWQSCVSIDWLRIRIPFSGAVQLALREYFGEASPCKGLDFFKRGLLFQSGARCSVHHQTDQDHHITALLDISGSVCQSLGSDRIWEVLRDFSGLGGYLTRLDIAVDYRGSAQAPVNLVELVAAHTCLGPDHPDFCLTGLKKVQEHKSWSALGLGHTVRLGRSGKFGSGKLVRVYDKGVESATQRAGRWQRWEFEAGGDVAAEIGFAAALELQGLTRESVAWCAATDAIMRQFREYALGVVDFRLQAAGNDKHLDRRPRCAWWAEILQDDRPKTITAPKPPKSLEGLSKWLKTSVMPGLDAMARACDGEVEDILRWLVGDDWKPIPGDPKILRRDPVRFAAALELGVVEPIGGNKCLYD